MKKPTLVIACSERKSHHDTGVAFDLYDGNIYRTIRANVPNAVDKLNNLILSAKYGLIEASRVIDNYDTMLDGNQKEIARFAAMHRKDAQKTIEDAERSGLFVFLPNKYLKVWDAWAANRSFGRVISEFESVYVCRGHRGNLELLSRLKRMLNSNFNQCPILFRSGVANVSECHGYALSDKNLAISP